MCDELTNADNERFLTGVSRRAFGAGAAATGIAALLPSPANAAPIKGRDVTVATPDGQCDAYLVAPARGRYPGVIVWPDIFGLRPAFRQMADRLAQSGYAVLTVNQFYRSTKTPFATAGEGMTPAFRDKVGPWRALLTPDATTRDATAFVAFLDKQPEVATKRGMGATGYCMGGPAVMLTAAAAPERVRAAATFHGGGMATAPMLELVPQMRASWLVAIAQNDDERAPGDKDKLRQAFAATRASAEIKVYPSTMHGWCPPDSQVYNAAQADRAWDRLLDRFGRALA